MKATGAHRPSSARELPSTAVISRMAASSTRARTAVKCSLRSKLQNTLECSDCCAQSSANGVTEGGSRRRALLAAGLFASLLSDAHDSHADTATTRAYFDVSVDRTPIGRIVVEVDPGGGAPVGARRFLDLAQGKEGVGFRRTRIELIQDGYIQDAGLKALSYKASGRTAIAGGVDTEALEVELTRSTAIHDGPGIVSLVVRNAKELESKDKLVALKGKLVTVTEVLGENPNGSAFAITTKAEPALDGTNLVIGRVVEGQDVVNAIAALPRVKDNRSSPFFQAGKATGDKRANVAERAFGKPFAKIVIEECGLLT